MTSKGLTQWLNHNNISPASFNLIYSPNLNFPFPPSSSPSSSPLKILVLDSSFNPPSRAHLALATPSTTTTKFDAIDAYLLVLSTKNADKIPKPGETTTEQRLSMMIAMAKEIEGQHQPSGEISKSNIAIASISEPTFVGKSTLITKLLSAYLASLLPSSPPPSVPPQPIVQLVFSQGFDTLTRFFDPKYYPNESMSAAMKTFFVENQSAILCARRGDVNLAEEKEFLAREGVREWIGNGRVEMIDLGEDERMISSTLIRKVVSEAKGDEERMRKNLKGLVVDGVAYVIIKEGLYS